MTRPLRIFLCCQQDLGGPPHPVPAYRFWRGYFASAFAEAGHELIEAPGCDWAAGLGAMPAAEAAAWREHTWARALACIREAHTRRPIDLFLSYLYPEQIHADALAELRFLGIPRVNFFCDNVREFRRVPAAFRPFDLHWVPEKKALALYARAGLATLHAPMPCQVPGAFRTPPARESHPVSFVGTRDELRAALFAEAFSLGLDARLWGRGWLENSEPSAPPAPAASGHLLGNQLAFVRRHGPGALLRKLADKLSPPPPVRFDFGPHACATADEQEFWTVTRESTVCLGVNRYPSPRHSPRRPDTYSRLRDLEAPMAGACYLTEWTEGLDALYEPGVEIETYRDAAELVEKTRALVADPARRARLRAAGQRRALAHHTIARTVETIARRLGLA